MGALVGRWVIVVSLFIFVSCRQSDGGETLGTTAQIARTVEMMRLSSSHDKRLWLNRLQQLACNSEDVCQLKSVCIHAYDAFLKSTDMIDLARHTIARPPDDAALPDASAESLLEAATLAQTAQRLLGQARAMTQNCAENEAVIRQRYRIH